MRRLTMMRRRVLGLVMLGLVVLGFVMLGFVVLGLVMLGLVVLGLVRVLGPGRLLLLSVAGALFVVPLAIATVPIAAMAILASTAQDLGTNGPILVAARELLDAMGWREHRTRVVIDISLELERFVFEQLVATVGLGLGFGGFTFVS
jgi:hypothetical protein